jgi:hypothetical protein
MTARHKPELVIKKEFQNISDNISLSTFSLDIILTSLVSG